MYLPTHFQETSAARISALVADHPLAVIVGQGADGIVANHIPLMMDRDDRLIGHVALNNDMHRILAEGADVLAIFQGPEAYISPNWYPSKANTHKAVPTWNYAVVHVRGTIGFLHDAADKRRIVSRLTKMMETRTNGADAWRMGDAPADYLAGMIDNIVGFDIAISQITAKTKAGQNKSEADRGALAARMDGQGKQRLTPEI